MLNIFKLIPGFEESLTIGLKNAFSDETLVTEYHYADIDKFSIVINDQKNFIIHIKIDNEGKQFIITIPFLNKQNNAYILPKTNFIENIQTNMYAFGKIIRDCYITNVTMNNIDINENNLIFINNIKKLITRVSSKENTWVKVGYLENIKERDPTIKLHIWRHLPSISTLSVIDYFITFNDDNSTEIHVCHRDKNNKLKNYDFKFEKDETLAGVYSILTIPF